MLGVEHVATAGAHHHHERTGFGHTGAGYAGVGVDDRRADGNARRQAKLFGDRFVEFTGTLAGGEESSRHLIGDDTGHLGVQCLEERARRIAVRPVPHGLVSRLTGRTGQLFGIASDELPHVPISRFEPDFGVGVNVGSGIQNFKHFWEKPFQPDDAAVARQPRLFAASRPLIDPLGLRFRAVMLPEFWPGVFFLSKRLQETKRCAIAQRGKHGAACEIDADADDRATIDAAIAKRTANCPGGTLNPIAGMLQCELRRQRAVVAGQGIRDLPVAVFDHGRTTFIPFQIDQQRADRSRAEVQTQCQRSDSGHRFTPVGYSFRLFQGWNA